MVDNMRIYLDNCCFNRPFDDQQQLRIRLETEAKLNIQEKILQKKIELAWSYILDFENAMNPFQQRKLSIERWKAHAIIDTNETEAIIKLAEGFEERGIKSKDALHLACAISLKCKYILTTDDHLLRKSDQIEGIAVIDPIGFIREELEW